MFWLTPVSCNFHTPSLYIFLGFPFSFFFAEKLYSAEKGFALVFIGLVTLFCNASKAQIDDYSFKIQVTAGARFQNLKA